MNYSRISEAGLEHGASTMINSVSDGLLTTEMELRQMGYWESEQPPEKALRSREPFCIDTLTFTQWLQFIFLPKMKALVEHGQPLPPVSGIAPMAEEFFQQESVTGASLIAALRQMDSALSQQ